MSGPIFTPTSVPRPTFSDAIFILTFSAKASYTAACTYIRLADTQVWPALRYFDCMSPSAAASRSASSKTIKGALPPNSSESFLIVSALWRIRMRPTSVEPVNESLRTMGLAHSSLPITTDDDALPVTILSTPFGIPARCASSAIASADSGVCSAGLMTIVQPAASAGATLRAIIAFGKFQGVIAAVTPIGCLMTIRRLSFMCGGMTSP